MEQDHQYQPTIGNRCMYNNQSIHHIIYCHTNSSTSYHLPSTRQTHISRAGAAPQRVVGQLQCGLKDAHARVRRVYHTQRALRGRGVPKHWRAYFA